MWNDLDRLRSVQELRQLAERRPHSIADIKVNDHGIWVRHPLGLVICAPDLEAFKAMYRLFDSGIMPRQHYPVMEYRILRVVPMEKSDV